MLARLVRSVRDIDLAQDALQQALEAALVQWPSEGVPEAPDAWLVRTARNKASDSISSSRESANNRPFGTALSAWPDRPTR